MVANGYSHMEMFRLSPRDGKALSRLNLFEGQILHGRVYRMEPYGPSGEGLPDRGGIAKIALGSHLIDAAVSKSLPQGARVVLEVVKLADESFILKLISVDEAQTNGGKVAQASVEPDLIDLSPEALEKIGQAVPRPQANSDTVVQQKLVEIPELATIPRDAARVVRAAITQGFIEPVDFTASVPTMRVVLHQAIEDFQATLANLPTPASTSTEAVEIVESINALISRIRAMIASLPATGMSADEEVAQVASALREIAGALRPVVQQVTDGSRPAVVVESEEISSEAQTASKMTGEGAETISANAKPEAVTDATQAPVTPKSAPADQAQAGPQQVIPDILPADPSSAKPADSAISEQIPVTPGMKGTSAEDIAGSTEQVSGAADESAPARMHPARNLLVAMRVLATLTQRLAESRGWTVEQSTELRHHAGRISNSTDALEGALIAPLLGRSIDVSDFLPRILFSFLFAGGNADLAVMQPEREGGGEGERDYEKEDGEQNRAIGVMRLRTEALGRMRILLDYAEADGVSHVGGRFIASTETAEAIRQSISALDRALDARGLTSVGFRIIGLKAEGENNRAPTNRAGGLDLKI
jgi:uncharacterized protein YoaH (UPF0181 family)